MTVVLTPDLVLRAYCEGIFPMAESADDDRVFWVCPEKRGQLSIADMHVPKRLKKNVRQMKLQGIPYEIRVNHAFEEVVKACGARTKTRQETWINPHIAETFRALHDLGFAHSVECWVGDKLVGGLYGLSIGAAFFGESMFSRVRDASKVCLVHLAARLYHAEYDVLDTQFVNDHLVQFGVYEISHEEYLSVLQPSLSKKRRFNFHVPCEKALVEAYLSRDTE